MFLSKKIGFYLENFKSKLIVVVLLEQEILAIFTCHGIDRPSDDPAIFYFPVFEFGSQPLEGRLYQ